MPEEIITWTTTIGVSKSKAEAAIKEGKLEEIFIEIRKAVPKLVEGAISQIEGEMRAAVDVMARYPDLGLVEAVRLVGNARGNPSVN